MHPNADPLAALRVAAEGLPAPVLAEAAAPNAPAGPRFVGGKPREKAFPLDFHVEFEGKVYDAIVLKRPSAKAVGDYFEYLRTRLDDESVFLPVFHHTDGSAVPAVVLDYLDAEDFDRVMDGLTDFLPPRLRQLQEAMRAVSSPDDGEPTEPKS